MAMVLTQVRLPEKIIKELDELVEQGYYASKSDVIRDAVRKLLAEKHSKHSHKHDADVKEVNSFLI